MNANLDKIAQELYGKIQTRFNNVEIGDENAEVLSKKEDIPNARFFEFEYEENGESLGTIAITLDEDDGIVVQVSGDLVNDDNDVSGHGAFKFIRSFRQFAKDRLLNFDIQNIGKSNLDKRDYQFQAKRKEIPMEPMMESKMYGTARMSYQDLGEARLIVKHTQPINTELAAGRTMHIEGIYIENADGERFKYPFKHLNGARALAEHIKAGGNPYDGIGKHICSLSEELASLRKFKGYVSRQEQLSEAMSNVTSRVIERIEEIKRTVQHLQRPAFYEAFAESFEAQEEQMIPEEVQNDLIDRLTIRTFNEELKSVFPYIAKFVKESELPVLEIDADDLLNDAYNPNSVAATHARDLKAHHRAELKKKAEAGDERAKAMLKHAEERDEARRAEFDARMERESYSPEDQFENFMDNIIREDKDEIFSPNKDAQNRAIGKLNQILSVELKGGPEGINAIESLRGLIDDPEFLNSLRDIDPDLDVRPLVQQFVLDTNPSIATQLHFGGEEEPPVAPPVEAPPVEAPPVDATAAPADAMAAPVEAPPVDATAAPVEPQPAPVAESEDPPFDGPYTKSNGDKKDKFGNTIKQKNVAKHLAKQGMADAIKKAKKAGATMETVLDFGHKEMTLGEAIRDCGMEPSEFGFEESGLPAMLKFISGFYNKDEGNFPLGGMRVKIKVKKAFEDGMFGESNPQDLVKVLKFIDLKDPSGNADGQQLHAIQRLAGVQHNEPVGNTMPKFDHDADNLNVRMSEISESSTDWMKVMKQRINFGK
jgi:hypothetical protein